MRQQVNIPSNNLDAKPKKFINVSEEQEIQIFAKQMLSKRLFVGHYQERRYVQQLNSYRDIVRVCDTEEDLVKDLLIVKRRVQQFFPPHAIWTGITDPDLPGAINGLGLWVKLKDLPFGQYQFQIREVQFTENEILLRLKFLRICSPDSGSSSAPLFSESKVPPSECKENTEEFDAKSVSSINIQDAFNFLNNIKYNELGEWGWSSFKKHFTVHNISTIGKFSCLLFISAFACLFKFVSHVGDFSIKFIHELSFLIHACTPLFLGIIDFFTKCVGGLFILIAMIWRGTPPNFPPQRQERPLPLQNFPYNQRGPYVRGPRKAPRF